MTLSKENQKQIDTMYENFRELRRSRRWSMEELSDISGIDAKILADIENGKDFDLYDFIRLCKTYNKKPHEMFEPVIP